jgi:hypothetical protein
MLRSDGNVRGGDEKVEKRPTANELEGRKLVRGWRDRLENNQLWIHPHRVFEFRELSVGELLVVLEDFVTLQYEIAWTPACYICYSCDCSYPRSIRITPKPCL